MRHPAIEKLLILQDRDQNRLSLEAQVAAVPGEQALVEKKIATEKGAIEAARTELKELETKKKLIETEIGSTETKLGKYKTQQMEVRKNDEFKALGNEIEHTEQAIGALEEQEIAVLYEIDTAKKKFADAEAEMKRNIAGHEARLLVLRERDASLRAELATALTEVAAARTPLDEPTLRLYDRVARRNMPVCVPVHGGKCGGCHLKISGEADAAARKGDQLATCDQCGRIVWWELG